MIKISFRLIPASFLAIFCLSAQTPVVMNRYDANITGFNAHEKILHAKNVNSNSFGKLYSYYIDGAAFAQPLYLPSVLVAGAKHNVLYVATMNDKVYAFDADKPGPPLWMRDLTNEAAGVTPVPIIDITNSADLNIVGNVGIQGTPVIDPADNAMYLVARTKEPSGYMQRLHKLDITTGADKLPPVIPYKLPGEERRQGRAQRDSCVRSQVRQSAGCASIVPWPGRYRVGLARGYSSVSRLGDGVRRRNSEASRCVVHHAGWRRRRSELGQSGRGPAVDEQGNIFFEVGNGTWDGVRDFGNSLIKLTIGSNGFSISDYFTPHDYKQLDRRDEDLGATGPLLIPNTNLILLGSKKGILYLLDRGNLGKMTPEDHGVIQQFDVKGGRILPGTAYWEGPSGPSIFLWEDADVLKGFRFNGHTLNAVPYAKGNVKSLGSPGAALTISSDQKQPGTGIVWATLTNGKDADAGNAAGVLRAYDAESLHELWDSEQEETRDRLGTLVKFVPPLVMAGKVYAPNYDNALVVYGLGPVAP